MASPKETGPNGILSKRREGKEKEQAWLRSAPWLSICGVQSKNKMEGSSVRRLHCELLPVVMGWVQVWGSPWREMHSFYLKNNYSCLQCTDWCFFSLLLCSDVHAMFAVWGAYFSSVQLDGSKQRCCLAYLGLLWNLKYNKLQLFVAIDLYLEKIGGENQLFFRSLT